MRANETFTQRRRSDLELLVRGVQAGMPGARHDAIESAVAIAAIRQGLSKASAIEAYRRLAMDDRARFVGSNDRRIEMRLLGISLAALDSSASPDIARSRAEAACHQQGLSLTKLRRIFDKALADRQAIAEAKRDRAERRRRRA